MCKIYGSTLLQLSFISARGCLNWERAESTPRWWSRFFLRVDWCFLLIVRCTLKKILASVSQEISSRFFFHILLGFQDFFFVSSHIRTFLVGISYKPPSNLYMKVSLSASKIGVGQQAASLHLWQRFSTSRNRHRATVDDDDDDGFRRCRHRCHITHARARSPPTVRIIADATAAYQRKRKRNAM